MEEKLKQLFKELEKKGVKKEDFNPVELKQIEWGFEAGLTLEQVKIYANPMFNDYQMEEIRLGLEHGIDVSFYNNPMRGIGEMKAIRLLLERNEIDLLTDKKVNAAYWDKIDNIIEKAITDIAKLSVLEIKNLDLYADAIIPDIREVIIKYLKRGGGHFPFIDEDM